LAAFGLTATPPELGLVPLLTLRERRDEATTTTCIVLRANGSLRAGMSAMSEAIYENSSLPIREREVARMRIAQLNQCHV
jgi:alkylhydroperoxidase family enzyme